MAARYEDTLSQDHPILSCEAALVEAQLASDVSTLDRLLDDELYFIGLGGSVFSKADDLAAHRSGQLRITKMNSRDRHITSLGSVVVVSVLMDAEATIDGVHNAAMLRYTRVWSQRSDGWRVVAGHMSAVQMADDKGTSPQHVAEFGKGAMPPPAGDGRLDAPAFHRNHGPILAVLARLLAGRGGDVLEIGSGTGQHAVEFSRGLADVTWWPSDHLDGHLHSIAAWREHAKLGNLRPPARIDASEMDWRLASQGLPPVFTAMFCANVVHIAPWPVAQGIFAAAARHLEAHGRLLLYGPFRRDGVHNSPGNEAFDEGLRRDNPEWGVRDTADLDKLAAQNGLRLTELIEMPANNAVLVFSRWSSSPQAKPGRLP